MSTTPKYSNQLIHETSPYLLQHAHNPVNWVAWSDEVLIKAKEEDKLILISIGYSACHWCHVMEHECFEDDGVAQLMNTHFICVKIDREERPDIDQIYMLAVQLMTGRGGWPLNCFALPDGRPIYGGTYFPKAQWMNILLSMADVYKNEKAKAIEYATKLSDGIRASDLIEVKNNQDLFDITTIQEAFTHWQNRFDTIEGGPDKAPKFPLPNNYLLLLRLCASNSNTLSTIDKQAATTHLALTLRKMAYGGIYDQIGGGFARYSVDGLWKVPHFEKMLYDNAQLVSLYSQAFQHNKNHLYKQVVYQTLEFVKRELTTNAGTFYAALDADSEGVEGKYYVWNKEELQHLLGNEFDLFTAYYNLNEKGYWEHNNYILLRDKDDEVLAELFKISIGELQKKIQKVNHTLLHYREKRVRPGLDTKIIVSWNALMAKAYIDAYNVFDEHYFLTAAIKNIEYILQHALQPNGALLHTINSSGKDNKNINGFLEDYAFVIESLLALYEATFNDNYLLKAKQLMEYSITHFCDNNTQLFYFTADTQQELVMRKMELSDNVIPASNSTIALSLFKLGHHLQHSHWVEHSKQMLNAVLPQLINYIEGYSNWAMLLQHFTAPFFEVVIAGKDANVLRKKFNQYYLPNVVFAGSDTISDLPLLQNRVKEHHTFIYICENNTCHQPFVEVNDALKLIHTINSAR